MNSNPTVGAIGKYTSIIIFIVVSLTQGFVISTRRLKLDPSALITMLFYYTVILVRFIQCFLGENDGSKLQVGISLSCHTLISMSIYFFVFEMNAVRL